MSDEHVRRTFVVENTWKCSACGNPNPGRDLKCQKCGQTKQKVDTDSVDADSAAEVEDQKLLDLAAQGENFACPFCGSQERAQDGKCRNCGSRVEEGTEALPGGPPQQPPPQAAPPPAPAPKKKHYLLFGGVALLGLMAWVCLVPHTKATKVEHIGWAYQVDLQQKTLSHGSGFSHPSDAFNISCENRQDGTHDCDPYKCNPHTEHYDCKPHDCKCHKKTTDKKNGFSQVEEVCETCYDKCDKTVEDTCQHQCPTYKEWCRYDFNAWPTVSSKKTEGSDQNVHWPDLVARDPSNQRLEKKETYSVEFTDGTKVFKLAPASLDEFKRFSVGASWKIKVNAAGQVWPEQKL